MPGRNPMTVFDQDITTLAENRAGRLTAAQQSRLSRGLWAVGWLPFLGVILLSVFLMGSVGLLLARLGGALFAVVWWLLVGVMAWQVLQPMLRRLRVLTVASRASAVEAARGPVWRRAGDRFSLWQVGIDDQQFFTNADDFAGFRDAERYVIYFDPGSMMIVAAEEV